MATRADLPIPISSMRVCLIEAGYFRVLFERLEQTLRHEFLHHPDVLEDWQNRGFKLLAWAIRLLDERLGSVDANELQDEELRRLLLHVQQQTVAAAALIETRGGDPLDVLYNVLDRVTKLAAATLGVQSRVSRRLQTIPPELVRPDWWNTALESLSVKEVEGWFADAVLALQKSLAARDLLMMCMNSRWLDAVTYVAVAFRSRMVRDRFGEVLELGEQTLAVSKSLRRKIEDGNDSAARTTLDDKYRISDVVARLCVKSIDRRTDQLRQMATAEGLQRWIARRVLPRPAA